MENHETVTVISDGQIDSQLDGLTDREVASWRLHAGHQGLIYVPLGWTSMDRQSWIHGQTDG